MPRYFLEVSYKGTRYSGFQIQENAVTIQSEIERAMHVFWRVPFHLTGSSRTDTGVHARQNFFHFDTNIHILQKHLYNLNAILSKDIVIGNIYKVPNDAHCRFDAISRTYRYYMHCTKNPFLTEISWYYPYALEQNNLLRAAAIVLTQNNFMAFSKKNSQVNNFNCLIQNSGWELHESGIMVYSITANRFLRGMVRALVATMLQVGRGIISLSKFEILFHSEKIASANFSSPAHGLFLEKVQYPYPLIPVE
ncbi:tRNA pseudouridine(38-40) synthase TruA [Hydrotalea sp.]|uniref:tRNA pseudouridine(38-40) synthase TruA n=1 Tax=Hydrotalea sp. TaxID=2881279 RepID=UPI002634BB22|nr:tRNA pseudouridine(38-40) synthase TruA [Hydrotalea sp.]